MRKSSDDCSPPVSQLKTVPGEPCPTVPGLESSPQGLPAEQFCVMPLQSELTVVQEQTAEQEAVGTAKETGRQNVLMRSRVLTPEQAVGVTGGWTIGRPCAVHQKETLERGLEKTVLWLLVCCGEGFWGQTGRFGDSTESLGPKGAAHPGEDIEPRGRGSSPGLWRPRPPRNRKRGRKASRRGREGLWKTRGLANGVWCPGRWQGSRGEAAWGLTERRSGFKSLGSSQMPPSGGFLVLPLRSTSGTPGCPGFAFASRRVLHVLFYSGKVPGGWIFSLRRIPGLQAGTLSSLVPTLASVSCVLPCD